MRVDIDIGIAIDDAFFGNTSAIEGEGRIDGRCWEYYANYQRGGEWEFRVAPDAQRDPPSVSVFEVEGFLVESEEDPEEARACIGAAGRVFRSSAGQVLSGRSELDDAVLREGLAKAVALAVRPSTLVLVAQALGAVESELLEILRAHRVHPHSGAPFLVEAWAYGDEWQTPNRGVYERSLLQHLRDAGQKTIRFAPLPYPLSRHARLFGRLLAESELAEAQR